MVDVRRLLPHRYPFLMVDAFVHQEGDAFECRKNVSHNEPFFVGHFPQEPVMPGVMIVEALAQAAAVGLQVREAAAASAAAAAIGDASAAGDGAAPEPQVGYLTGIEKARFRRKVVPGDVLRLTGTITRYRRGLCTVEAVALVGDEVAAEATLSFALAR
jgi:3-hydroxyacyl-[acyl-carrier-protein] dehydratase